MTDRTQDVALMRRYLLGRANQAESDALEQRYFAEDDVFADLESVADDLAGDYAAGRLEPDDRQRFERHCLQSTDDVLRARFAAALERFAGKRRTTRAETGQAPHQPRVQARPRSSWWALPAVRLAWSAATLLLVAGLAIVMRDAGRLRSELRATQSALDRAGQAAVEQTAAARATQAALERQLATATTLSIALPATTRRSAPIDVPIPAGATFVRLEMPREPGTFAGPFRAVLRSSGRPEVWSQIVPAVSPDAPAIVLAIPAIVLTPGAYELAIEEPRTPAPPPHVFELRVRNR